MIPVGSPHFTSVLADLICAAVDLDGRWLCCQRVFARWSWRKSKMRHSASARPIGSQ